jgi:hypothetical protein
MKNENWIVSRVVSLPGPHYGDVVILDVESQETVALVRAGPGIYTRAASSQERSDAIALRDERAKVIADAPRVLRERDAIAVHLKRVLDRIDQQHQDEIPDWTEDDCDLFNQARAALDLCEKEAA